jgi:hypothetical protein
MHGVRYVNGEAPKPYIHPRLVESSKTCDLRVMVILELSGVLDAEEVVLTYCMHI